MQHYHALTRGLARLAKALFLGMLLGQFWFAHAQTEGGVAPTPDVATVEFVNNYKLGPGDIISIRVLGEQELSIEKARISDVGTIPMPAIGEVNALGRTIGEVERMVVEKLRGRILLNPQVSVLIEEYRPFFINGMVQKPGGYPFLPGLTVRKAAALAGGFRERASLKKIYLIRESDKTQTPVNVDLNAAVLPGDIVTVEESFF
ncbi:polysaccharide biosynthesis/export family protein [Aquabacterium sp.]|uniref:polysaccharide biosynthesis/export family protein n=1 Tax=Aquabacterium sp. TaxID=1872578 RepID=UPI0035AF4EDA